MKIVKLSELNDEERRKLIEEEENRINQRNKERINIQQQANADFNNQIAKSGSYQSKGSTSLGTLRKLYKDNSVTEKSLNNYYNTHKNNNQKTMWDRIKDTAGNSLKQTAIGMTGNPMWSLLGNINNNVNKFVTDEQKNKVGYIGKRTGAGVIQGVTGIGQAGLTDLANQANKGKDKNITNTIGDVVKSFTNISNPASRINPIQTGINTLKTLTDKDKNILQKGISLATGGISDTLNQTIPGKDIINSTTQALGKINPNTSNTLLKYTNAISKPSEDINEKLNEEGQKYDTITNMLAGAGQTIGNMAPSIALSTVNPTAGLGLMGLSAKGQSTQEALKKGASLDEAVKIGDTKGMIEIGTEMLSGGINIFGKGALDDLVQKGVVDKVKNKVAKKLVQMGVNNAGEVGEELVSDVLGTLIDKGTVDPNAKYTLNDFKDTAINTILTTTVLNFLTGGLAGNVGSINNTKSMNIEQQNQVENQNNINTQQITQTPNNLSQNQTSEQIKATETLKQEIQNSKLSSKEKTNMMDYVNNNNIEQNTYNNMREAIDNANQNISSNKNLYNETANKYNVDINNNTVKSIQEVTEKRGIQARYDADIFNNSNEEAIWTQKEDGSREIVINPNADSTKTLQNIAVHELFHDFAGTQEKNILTKMALEKMKTQEGYENAMKSLSDAYAQKYDINSENFNKLIEEEASAKFLGENLGNQEFIDELITKQNRSTVQKVYDWVVDKVDSLKNKITGDVEAEYWRKVKNNFEKAFNKQYQGEETISKLGILTNNKNQKYVKADRQVINGKDSLKWEKQVEDYINSSIKKGKDVNVLTDSGDVLTITKDTSGKAKFRNQIRDKNGNIRYLNNKEFLSKLTAETHIDELAQISQKINKKTIPDHKNHSFAKDGFDYRTAYFEDFDGQYYKITMSIGKNGNINTIYNIGKMDKKNRSKSSLVAQRPSNQKITSNEDTTSINSISSNKNDVNTTTKYSMQESENNSDSINLLKNKKQQQLEIIQKNNPMQDDYHTGIRKVEDIKTLEETLNDSEWADYSEFDPDYTREMAEKSIKSGKITVYSSYPIEQGVFISPSYMEAESYSSNGKVFSKEVNVDDVAWIDPTQGQYAKVDNKKYSQSTTFDNFVKQNSINKGTGETIQQVKLPSKKVEQSKKIENDITGVTKAPIGEKTKELEQSSSFNLPKKQQKLPTMKDIVSKGEEVDFSEMERPKGKIRKHYKSIIESNNTTKEAKAIAKKMMGTDTYIPESNNNQLERANKRIENSTPDAELQSLMSRSTLGDKITPTDIAVGERLIQYYSLVGDKAKLQDAIQATAMAGTTAGQTVQAMSLLNHQTPEGQAIWIQRSVEKMNEALRKNRGENTEQFNLTPDMLESIVNSKNETELQENVNKVYEELGQQVSKSTMEKIDSWRYFAMLANPRTHIRNIVGNIAMGKTQSVKNKVAGVIEGVASKINSDMERTHTIVPSSAKVKEFAKNDIVNVLDRLGISENKYNPQTRLQNSMKTFKSDMLENTIGKAFGLNDKLLEAEDGWGLKAGYEKALAEYMTANKLTPDNITDAQLGKARNYAVQQAKEATFHQECQLASLVNQLSNKNKFAKYTTDAILPFVKTPMNVAKAGMEYSPVGLAKSMVLDTSRLRKGDINVNQYIDNISKGLTGTGIALVGYALAQCGILKASGDEDDKKEKYDENQGKQTYSIQIGDNTYSLDWLAPTGIPLFIGAEISEMSKAKAEEKTSLSSDSESKYSQTLESGTNLLNAMANSMNPMTEMSMLSGLTSALSSYEQGSAQMLASIGTNSVKSYVNQFVPTALGQIAKTTDEYERSTTSTKSGILPKAIDSTKNQIISKIPGLRQKLPTKTDVWGNDLKQNEGQDTVTQVLDKTISDTGRKFIENAIFPWTRKKISSNNVDKELTDLYDSTGESSVLPSTLDKTLTIDGQKYRMTSNEYANYKKQYGKTAFTIFSNIIKTNDYKNLSEGSRKEVIEDIYSYSKELLKKDYAEKNSLEYTPSTMMKTINSIEYSGGNANTYFKYQGAVSQLKAQKVSSGELEEGQNIKDTDKMQLLVNSNYSNKEKSAIFENCIVNSNENNFYTIALKDSTININEYLQYKIKESNEEFTSDKDKYGNSISGTSKKKYYNYINNNITGYNNKLLLLAQKYKLSNNERQDLTEYINKKYKGQDRIDVFKKLTQNYKVSNDNKIYYK